MPSKPYSSIKKFLPVFLETNLMILKESYLKVQGALELLEHLNTEESHKITQTEEKNVEGNDS